MARFRNMKRRHRKGKKPMYKISAKKLARRAIRMVKGIKPEVKYTDFAAIGQQFNYDALGAYIISPLTLINQGTGDANARVGDEIRLLSQVAKFTLRCALFDSIVYRLVCFQYLSNPDATIPKNSIGNLFFESAYMGTVNAVNAPMDYDNRKSFHKVYDKSFTLNPGTGISTGGVIVTREVHVNLTKHLNKIIQYQGGSNNITKNELFWVFLSDHVANGSSSCSYVIRTYFLDA